eukprot:Gregarina_sp_Poly_1__1185@NODE_128_length_13277_cov_115_450643_g114_i0_p10_GENE_NODE_128_length_13277_cov_115_450643_g114_i0NODE_128_length_13277_cov_115_450643_g114_i0_p10_ORF_typecomplete_len151_score17_99DIX/PF00778_17/0_051_NODE_128_length_13277_cov_115_450643_g114_i033333785
MPSPVFLHEQATSRMKRKKGTRQMLPTGGFLCFYFCPEDGDTEETMSCFIIENILHVTIADVMNAFPFKGDYYFRVGIRDKSNSWLWLDPPSPNFRVDFDPTERRAYFKAIRHDAIMLHRFHEDRGPKKIVWLTQPLDPVLSQNVRLRMG